MPTNHALSTVTPVCQQNHVGRHGSRHNTKIRKPERLLDTLKAAHAYGGLTAKGKVALDWAKAFLAEETSHLGELTP